MSILRNMAIAIGIIWIFASVALPHIELGGHAVINRNEAAQGLGE